MFFAIFASSVAAIATVAINTTMTRIPQILLVIIPKPPFPEMSKNKPGQTSSAKVANQRKYYPQVAYCIPAQSADGSAVRYPCDPQEKGAPADRDAPDSFAVYLSGR